jgi:uncharacterized membrane protein YgcG
MATSGDGSILQYLDPNGHACLQALLTRAKRTLQHPAPLAAAACLRVASERLEHEFVVGLQTQFDASLLLFGAALRWDRADLLYSAASMVKHDTRTHPLAKKLDAEWTLRPEQILGTLRARFSPLDYHQRLFEQGVRVFERQLAQFLGPPSEVAAQVATYQAQNAKFTACYERVRSSTHFNTCDHGGLAGAAAARRTCTAALRKGSAAGASRGQGDTNGDYGSSSDGGGGSSDGSGNINGAAAPNNKKSWGRK